MNIRPSSFARLLAPSAVVAAITLATVDAAAASAPPTSPPDSDAVDVTAPFGSLPEDSLPFELPEGYVWLVDDTTTITVAVPETWTEVDTVPAVNDDGSPLPWISAAPDYLRFRQSFDTPGVLFVASRLDENLEALMSERGLSEGCADITVEPYEKPGFSGLVQVGSGCGETGEASWQMVAAIPESEAFTAVIQVKAASAADEEAMQIVVDSFDVAPIGGVPGSTVPGDSAPPTTGSPPTTES